MPGLESVERRPVDGDDVVAFQKLALLLAHPHLGPLGLWLSSRGSPPVSAGVALGWLADVLGVGWVRELRGFLPVDFSISPMSPMGP